jgi:NDP-sugar pyrophosphorylase family protein
MDAMILAAGLGTRLGDITRDTPKALVDVAGRTALDRVALRLIAAGADRLVINVHHHADRIIEHVRGHDGWGVEVVFSREEGAPLETGGGLLKAAPLLRRNAPFLLHNVDVVAGADLRALYEAHEKSDALATLAVHERRSGRYLLFEGDRLRGRVRAAAADTHGDDIRTGTRRLAFAGIHAVSPGLLDRITERGAFSIMDVYLRLAAAGERIAPFDVTGTEWLEIGTPARLDAARKAWGQAPDSR